MAVLGLRFCARDFFSCGEWGPLFIAVREPLTVAASLVEEHTLQTRRLSSCGSRAQLLCGMWDLPRPRLEPVSPALAGRFSTTVPPGKPLHGTSCFHCLCRHPFWGPCSLPVAGLSGRARLLLCLVVSADLCHVCTAYSLFLYP